VSQRITVSDPKHLGWVQESYTQIRGPLLTQGIRITASCQPVI